VYLRGHKMDSILEALAYVAAQLAGALTFGGLASVYDDNLPNGIGYPAKNASSTDGAALLCEIVLTFALCHTILHVATTHAQANNHYFGVAIGVVVVSGAISVGGISGGAFNPAVSMRWVIKGKGDDIWLYWLGPLLGGALAALSFRIMNPGEVGGFCDLFGQENSKDPQFDLGFMVLKPVIYRKYIVEFIGTFMLCFTVGTAVAIGAPLAAFSIGFMLVAQVYAGGAVSGANYNPAVSLGLLVRFSTAGVGPACAKIREHFGYVQCAGYIAVQFVAALFAAATARACLAGRGGISGFPNPTADAGEAFLIEVIATFALVLVVLNSATVAATSGYGYFGLAIGWTVLSMAIATGGIGGGAMNPAVAIMGIASGTSADLSKTWIYYVACPLGGLLAGLIFHILNPSEFRVAAPEKPQFSRMASVRESKQQVHLFHAGHEHKKPAAEQAATHTEEGGETEAVEVTMDGKEDA